MTKLKSIHTGIVPFEKEKFDIKEASRPCLRAERYTQFRPRAPRNYLSYTLEYPVDTTQKQPLFLECHRINFQIDIFRLTESEASLYWQIPRVIAVWPFALTPVLEWRQIHLSEWYQSVDPDLFIYLFIFIHLFI